MCVLREGCAASKLVLKCQVSPTDSQPAVDGYPGIRLQGSMVEKDTGEVFLGEVFLEDPETDLGKKTIGIRKGPKMAHGSPASEDT